MRWTECCYCEGQEVGWKPIQLDGDIMFVKLENDHVLYLDANFRHCEREQTSLKAFEEISPEETVRKNAITSSG